MFSSLLAPLAKTLRSHFGLSKSRLETFAVLIVGLVNCRTVNLSHIASQFPGPAQHASNYRRLQRFFQYVRLDCDLVAQIVVRMLKLDKCRCLVLDRTNWKLGNRNINILMLAVVTHRFRVPLMWTMLDKQGTSNIDERIGLIERYLALFGASSIQILLADREFIGAQWMRFLNKNNVPFAIRIKEDMLVSLEDAGLRQFRTLLRKRRSGVWQGWLTGMEMMPQNRLCFAARRIRQGELIIVATNTGCARQALNTYRRRWGIECLFSDTKRRGFNLEDTHITDPEKLTTLIAIIAMAVTWSCRCASQTMGRKAIGRKAHGRRHKSWFRTGFDTLRNWIIHKPETAKMVWIKSWQNT